MATISHRETGSELSTGLQGCKTCDEAILAAEHHADNLGEPVELHDDDGRWLVYPLIDAKRACADFLVAINRGLSE